MNQTQTEAPAESGLKLVFSQDLVTSYTLVEQLLDIQISIIHSNPHVSSRQRNEQAYKEPLCDEL